MELHKNCTSCNENLPLDMFHKAPQNKFKRTGACKKCRNAVELLRRNSKPKATRTEAEYEQHKASSRAWQKQARKNDPVKFRLGKLKRRARERGLLFSLTSQDVTPPKNCPCCGKPIDPTADFRSDNTPSVDRVDNSIGYISSNCAVICWRCNRIKSDASPSELRNIADWIETELKKRA